MELRYLKDLWNDAETVGMDEAELLRYRSNLLGADLRITNFAGGNTSAKVMETDPITGEQVEVLWVKGSGGDLGSMKRDGLASLYMTKLEALKKRYRGLDHEDEMVDFYPYCTFNNNPRAASIDTPLHAFIPFKHVDHLHPDWAIAVAACANGRAQLDRLREETGLNLLWIPWLRPGFELGLWLEKAVEESPEIDGIILASHGLFTWGDTSRESCVKSLDVLDKIGAYVLKRVEAKGDGLFGGQVLHTRADQDDLAAQVIPAIRGAVGRVIGHFRGDDTVMRFVNSARGKALAWQGTSCPDHFLRSKVRPLWVDWDPATGTLDSLGTAVAQGMQSYGKEYAEYYNVHRSPDSPALRSSTPSVILVPGLGMFSFGRSKSEARITGEFYVNAINVMAGATALADLSPDAGVDMSRVVDNYVALPLREAFNIEYWQLEEAKLKRMPPEKELSRRVAVVVGAGPGIGHAVADRLAKEGAHVVVADLNSEAAQTTAEALKKAHGAETIGCESVDCTDRASVRRMLRSVALQFGGVDILVQTAAVFVPPNDDGRTTDDQWRKTLEVNLTGSMIAADEAHKLMKEQGTGGSIVLFSSANAVVAKKGSWAYDTGKAALNHLVREMAVEFAPSVRVNAVAPASVVEGSVQFPRERVMSSLAKYGIAFDGDESTESLRDKLSGFYSRRTLLQKKVNPAEVAEAAFLLASNRLSLTTGQVIPVDAGLTEAFLR
jgi:rhamnulose-1-phosphate aldolase/alcohol dehydrogenase